MRYKITISYDGTNYCGWQVQNNGISIQSVVQKALATVLRSSLDLSGSSRTDAGVHAEGQVAHFDWDEPLDLKKLVFSLNSLLPSDIRIVSLEKAKDSFHARYSALEKIYRYHLCFTQDPFTKLYSLNIAGPLDLDAIGEALGYLVGKQDFSSFANAGGKENLDPVRTLFAADFNRTDEGGIFTFRGNGFLYKMVRNIVGTLIDVGKGRIPAEKIPLILAAKDRKKAGASAPAKGLFLQKILYENETS